MHLTHLIVTRGIIHVYTSAMRMLCRCDASAAKNFRGSASGAILILWCTGIIMQRKVIVIFMDNQLLQIQNRTCRIYGTASAEYLLLQMVDEHDLAGMEREVEAIHRQCYTYLNHTSAAYKLPPAKGTYHLCTRLRRVCRNNPPWRSL